MPPVGQTITVLRPTGTDQYGDPLPAVEHTITGCVWWPRESTENTDLRGTVITGYMLSTPHNGDVLPQDQVILPGETDSDADPILWKVDGDIGRWASPYTSRRVGATVALRRVSG